MTDLDLMEIGAEIVARLRSENIECKDARSDDKACVFWMLTGFPTGFYCVFIQDAHPVRIDVIRLIKENGVIKGDKNCSFHAIDADHAVSLILDLRWKNNAQE